jgi:hypothetical protein
LYTYLSAGAIGRELRNESICWVGQYFDEMAAEPSFLELPCAEVAALVAPDSVESQEEVVFAAVLAWVKEDEVGRKIELDRLLPLVQFPLMKGPATAMMTEPLVAQHSLAARDAPRVRPAPTSRWLPRRGLCRGSLSRPMHALT